MTIESDALDLQRDRRATGTPARASRHDHDHDHTHAVAAPASPPAAFSPFLASALDRLVLAIALAGAVWIAVLWAVK